MKTIMIVDDSESDQFYNEVILTSTIGDIKIIKAYDGEEALEILESTHGDDRPEVILLDINMPRMNGHEFLEAYSKNNTQDAPPVVVMLTSSEQTDDKDKALHYICVKDYLVKPITAEKVEELQSLLDKI